MRVQRVLMPGSGEESWTLLGDDHVPVGPAERFLSRRWGSITDVLLCLSRCQMVPAN